MPSNNLLTPSLSRPAADVDGLLLFAVGINALLALVAAWFAASLPLAAWVSGGCMVLALAAARLFSGTLTASLVISSALGVLVALQLYLTPGMMGVHTNITLSMVMLLAYRDWRPIALLTAAFVAHPLVMESQRAGLSLQLGLVTAQGLLLCRLALALHRLAREAHELAFLVNAMGRDGPIRLNLDVVRAETTVGKRLKDVQRRMAEAMRQVREAAHSVQQAASMVAMSSTELRGRTDQTANGLQESAMCLDQIGIIVRHSSDASAEAKAMSATAAAIADEGGSLVSQVVSSMHDIETSSKKIHDIVGVIDSIAFQTNILALNAAVEAARAGEQGRGFAVVAAEVRSLAQRSAAAAREIKGLIGTSSATVERGTQLVGGAGNTMTQLVGSVRRVGELFEAITADAEDHAQGLQSVTQSMQELSVITRQNVAVAEQSSDIASALQAQANSLSEVLSAFRLGGESASQNPNPNPSPSPQAMASAEQVPAATPKAEKKPAPEAPSAASGVVEFF